LFFSLKKPKKQQLKNILLHKKNMYEKKVFHFPYDSGEKFWTFSLSKERFTPPHDSAHQTPPFG